MSPLCSPEGATCITPTVRHGYFLPTISSQALLAHSDLPIYPLLDPLLLRPALSSLRTLRLPQHLRPAQAFPVQAPTHRTATHGPLLYLVRAGDTSDALCAVPPRALDDLRRANKAADERTPFACNVCAACTIHVPVLCACGCGARGGYWRIYPRGRVRRSGLQHVNVRAVVFLLGRYLTKPLRPSWIPMIYALIQSLVGLLGHVVSLTPWLLYLLSLQALAICYRRDIITEFIICTAHVQQ